jgi:4-hydroxy-3-methylbut-2-enyl diphosphate reductase
VEVCRNAGTPAHLVDDRHEVRAEWFEGVEDVVVTAGASAPEHLVQDLIRSLSKYGFDRLEEMEIKQEDVRFSLPSELQQAARLTQIAL